MDETKLNILRQIKDKEISSAEALHLLKGLGHRTAGIDPKPQHEKAVQGDSPYPGGTAVIGMACLFPDAVSPRQFWQNLASGKDSVGELSRARRENQDQESDRYPKDDPFQRLQGGFLSHIDRFDPFFFNISPKQAELMDPQQRLFLQEAWHALEDAGYSPALLDGTHCGVFVGYNSVDYQETLQRRNISPDANSFIGNLAPVLAARISYVLNLKGPNVAVNTACSSSLVAVHLACESIRSGDSEMALAGGVQLMTTNRSHLYTGSTGMLSPDGKCKTFDHGADGFVPGEGIGVIVLKPIKAAVTDGDQIYGIITGSGINQDGKTNGITAPSAPSQTDLERRVYTKYDINPETIGYVEAHGTGTELGDPIEVQALTEAFRTYTDKRQFCALGSVKTNIGHTMAASGIAGLIKALLCLHYKRFVPSLHFEKANPHIDFENSPFYVNTRLKDWPTISGYPRRAAVSSFGMSGSNAHVVLEEYQEPEVRGERLEVRGEPQLIVLSAKNEDRLKAYASAMLEFIQNRASSIPDKAGSPLHSDEHRVSRIENIAHTLQVGRDAMEERLALVVSDLNDLRDKLAGYVRGESPIEGLFCGSTAILKAGSEDHLRKDPSDRAVDALRKRDLHTLARLWVSGEPMDWQLLHRNLFVRRIPLPTYPFAQESYWAKGSIGRSGEHVTRAPLHPLLDSNESTLEAECFLKTFRKEEFYLRDHHIQGRPVLPGVAYLEMARAAGERARPKDAVTGISNVIWALPIDVGQAEQNVVITLYPRNGNAAYDIHTQTDDNRRRLHSQGELIYATKGNEAVAGYDIDIRAIRDRCPERIPADAFYRSLEAAGICYGPSFRNLRQIFRNDREVLSRIALSSQPEETCKGFVLHPSMLDGALQTVTGLIYPAVGKTAYVPFALDRIDILGPLSSVCYAHATYSGDPRDSKTRKYHIDLADAAGHVLVRLRDFSVRAIDSSEDKPAPTTVFFRPQWRDAPISVDGSVSESAVLLFDRDASRRSELQKRLGSEIVLVTPGETYRRTDVATFSLNPRDPDGYRELLNRLNTDNRLPGNVVHVWSQDRFTGDEAGLTHQLETGFLSVFHLSRALLELKPVPKTRLIYLYHDPPDTVHPLYAAFGAFAETIRKEHPNLIYKAVGFSHISRISDVVADEIRIFDGSSVRYRNGLRQVLRIADLALENGPEKSALFKEKGVYLITGGAGGIGLILADFLASRVKGNLVLTGRSELTDEKVRKIKQIKAHGTDILYIRSDVSKRQDVAALLDRIHSRFKTITGIIHCAGVVKDDYLLKKEPAQVRQVLAPKVFGTVFLDEMTKDEPLEFFVLFSSLSAVAGSIGQTDYAFANSFMDYYARYREQLCRGNQRRGKSISFNWPLWRDGGMDIAETDLAMMAEETGLVPLSANHGIAAFEIGLKADCHQIIVSRGDSRRIAKLLKHSAAPVGIRGIEGGMPEKRVEDRKAAEHFIKGLLSRETGLSEDRIGTDVPLEKYGLDSVMVMSLNRELEKDFGNLSKTLFFEYQTVAELADFFAENFGTKIPGKTGGSKPPRQSPARFPDSEANRSITASEKTDVAIIGVSGRYPRAGDLETFWENLKSGMDCITEIPINRWDYHSYYDPKPGAEGRISSKWGGFMEDVDKFDAPFFNISPREAETMDPQERLFLETIWHVMEDAGYPRSLLWGSRVGVFVGVMWGEYQLFGPDVDLSEKAILPGTSYASIANRVSYSFNFTGPSIALDTMCSSSLTAIHCGCESLKSGESELAIAGGVNVSIHVQKYLHLSQAMMTSLDGRCRSFGAGGDGYVPGEGVGAVLLKPLDRAISDRDHIYAVIKGSSINHGGKTNGYTVPNPNAQADVISHTLKRAGVSPETISYIETHGTGTALGDPIEIAGLVKAYGKSAKGRQSCPIGSVKSNVGHLESAAGISGLTKILLQMKHKQIAPSIHAETLNPNIRFEDTPFYVQRELGVWEKPKVQENGEEKQYPRRAGLSSFGAGGANAHVVLEEYQEPEVRGERLEVGGEPQLIVLSAKNEERLRKYAASFVKFLEIENREPATQTAGKSKIEDIAYTLQVGREPFPERLAVVVSDLEELAEKLGRYLGDGAGTDIEGLYHGNSETDRSKSDMLVGGKAGASFIRTLMEEGDLKRLAQLWVFGAEIDWHGFHAHKAPKRISIPTYPFARNRYWVSAGPRPAYGTAAPLHPLIDGMDPALSLELGGVVFKKVLKRTEPIVQDHEVLNRPLMPGAGFLEMAVAGGRLVKPDTAFEPVQLVFATPLDVKEVETEVHLIVKEETDRLVCRIQTLDNGHETTHATLFLYPIMKSDAPKEERIDIEAIQSACLDRMDKESLYNRFRESGIGYGEYFQGIQEIWGNTSEALARIALPSENGAGAIPYTFPPALLDAALQTMAGIGGIPRAGEVPSPVLRVPFSIERVEILDPLPLPSSGFAYAKTVASDRFDIAILDDDGRVCCRLHEVTVKSPPDLLENLLYRPRWLRVTADGNPPENESRYREPETILLVSTPEPVMPVEAFKPHLPGDRVVHIRLGTENRNHSDTLWEIETDNPLAMEHCLKEIGDIHHICFLGGRDIRHAEIPDLTALERCQEQGVISLFRLIKALIRQNRIRSCTRLTVVTHDVHPIGPQDGVNPFAAGLIGLAQVIAREYPEISVHCIDLGTGRIGNGPTPLQQQPVWENLLDLIHRQPSPGITAVRDGVRYIRTIEPIRLPPVDSLPFKESGVYFILGGAGGIGMELSRYLAGSVNARLVLIGRRPLSDVLKESITLLEDLGGEAVYIRADAADPGSMKAAVAEAEQRFKRIDGVIHSALVLKDRSLANMEEDAFRSVMAPKVAGSVVLHQAFKGKPLDFMMFFSSAQSFFSNAGQGNYAAASTFEDAFAFHVNQGESYPVYVINWGYWGSVGIVSDETQRKRQTALGLGSIEPEEGMEAVKRVLCYGVSPIIPLKAETRLLRAMGLAGSDGSASSRHALIAESDGMVKRIVLKPPLESGIPGTGLPSGKATLPANDAASPAIPDTENPKSYVAETVKGAFRVAVGFSEEEISDEMLFSEYGVDSIIGVKLINRINDTLGILLKTTVIFDHPNLKALSDYIYSTHKESIAGKMPNKFVNRPSAPVAQAQTGETAFTTHTADTDSDGNGSDSDSGIHRAAVVTGPGDISDLQILPIQPADPAGTEVQILVRAFSLNFGDWLCVQGLYPTMPPYPFTPGFEVSGIVLKTGPDARRVQPGDRVMALTGTAMGGHATLVTVDETQVVKKPEHISFEAACAFPVVFLTVHHVFELARVRKGEKVLIQTAAGGVGLIAVQMARLKGTEIYATAGSREKLDYLKEMGVSHLINYRETDFARRLMALTGGYGADVVINTLSGDAIQKGIDCLSPGGRYVEIAMTGMVSAGRFDLSKMTDNQTFFSVDLKKLYTRQPERIPRDLDIMAQALGHGAIRPTVGKVFPFSGIADAYGYLRDRRNIGKIVVTAPTMPTPKENRIEMGQQPPAAAAMNIAIIGVAGRFPGAEDARAFWDNIAASKCAVTGVPENRWSIDAYFDPDPGKLNKTHCRWGGFVDPIDRFDPLFFNISGKEAALMDPQQRLFLEVSWAAMEDAGYATTSVSEKKCGVYVGVGRGDYQSLMDQAGIDPEAHSFWGNADSVLAARISYFLNLKGPSIAIDTACSSSLVAIHLGCQSILSNECDMAIAGGIFICATPKFHILASNSGMLSSDGRCRAFDDEANGFVPGEGVGAVVLKPLSAAQNDGDPIYGVIIGSGINQDGKTMDITAPSSRSQTELEVSVYRKFRIDPETITYVEAHGTGTRLGDPIEVDALTHAFRKFTDRKQYCAVGSVKTNIGHAGSAAGIASVIKVLHALKNREIPPSLNFETANTHIDFGESPFYVNTMLRLWNPPDGIPRRAAVSSFGFSGTNAHLVIEEYRDGREHRAAGTAYESSPQLILLSAKTEDRLHAYVVVLKDFIAHMSEAPAVPDDTASGEIVLEELSEIAAGILEVGGSDVDPDETLEACGFDPMGLALLAEKISERFHLNMDASILTEHPTLGRVSDFLHQHRASRIGYPESVHSDNRKPSSELSLADIAYTLQIGRQHMEWRLATVVSNIRELEENLKRFISGNKTIPRFYSGKVESGGQISDSHLDVGALDAIAQRWIMGADIEWEALYTNEHRRRISLPTYPFARERYWIDDGNKHDNGPGLPEGSSDLLEMLRGLARRDVTEEAVRNRLHGEVALQSDGIAREE